MRTMSYVRLMDMRNLILCQQETIPGGGAINKCFYANGRAMPSKMWLLDMYRSTKSKYPISLLERAFAKYNNQI